MPIYETFSRRKRRAENQGTDVYQYDAIPIQLRGQIQHIWNDAIGPYYEAGLYFDRRSTPNNNHAWEFIRDTLCRDLGVMRLTGADNAKQDCVSYLTSDQNVDDLLSLIEVSFRYVDRILRKVPDYDRRGFGIEQSPEDAIDELNYRFRQASVGYQFERGRIVRVDSALIHSDVIQPALHLLSDPRFSGPEQEFLEAHAHYRYGEYKESITGALKAFESTMKAICDIKEWPYEKKSRATDLLKVLRSHQFFPDYLDNSFDQLVATLSSGLPQVRNQAGGHGQGAQLKLTPSYVAGYALHLAAAKIVFLVEVLKGTKKS